MKTNTLNAEELACLSAEEERTLLGFPLRAPFDSWTGDERFRLLLAGLKLEARERAKVRRAGRMNAHPGARLDSEGTWHLGYDEALALVRRFLDGGRLSLSLIMSWRGGKRYRHYWE